MCPIVLFGAERQWCCEDEQPTQRAFDLILKPFPTHFVGQTSGLSTVFSPVAKF